jgi:glycosyltransferase involved in cell wall biosynthesis
VLNRCTDQTGNIAARFGATLVEDNSRCLAAIRNRGVEVATGRILVTCDADSRLHPNMFGRVLEELERRAIGGGVDVAFDRRSVGIRVSEALLRLAVRVTGVSCGAFWTTREAFDEIGGFDEKLVMAEDYDFGRRLRALGKARGARYRTLWDTPLTTSSRKFDRFGDWSLLRMLVLDAARIRRSLQRRDTEFVDEYFYDFNANTSIDRAAREYAVTTESHRKRSELDSGR